MVTTEHPGFESGDPQAQRWARLADDILVIAREIQFRGYRNADALPLTPSEGMVMRHMQLEPDTTFASLLAAVGLQRTNLSTVLRGLEQKGLIERRVRPDDRRAITIHRTPRGRTNFAIVSAEWATAVSSAAGGEVGDLDAALTLLETIRQGLVSTRPPAPSKGVDN